MFTLQTTNPFLDSTYPYLFNELTSVSSQPTLFTLKSIKNNTFKMDYKHTSHINSPLSKNESSECFDFIKTFGMVDVEPDILAFDLANNCGLNSEGDELTYKSECFHEMNEKLVKQQPHLQKSVFGVGFKNMNHGQMNSIAQHSIVSRTSLNHWTSRNGIKNKHPTKSIKLSFHVIKNATKPQFKCGEKRPMSIDTHEIKTEVKKSCLPVLITHPKLNDEYIEKKPVLPISKIKDTNQFISIETMNDVLEGVYSNDYDQLIIIDCRFPYEYQGGHIKNAINIISSSKLNETLFNEPIVNALIIFHCEFSIQRGPRTASFTRRKDRQVNSNCYPHLNYPNVFVLEGGYESFYKKYPHYCVGEYIPMKQIEFTLECQKESRAHLKQFERCYSEGFLG